MRKLNELWAWTRRQPHWRLATGGGVLVLLALWLWNRGGSGGHDGLTFTVRRGPLDISVIEHGSAQALESQEVKCEVRVGYEGVKILKIVEEGYQVTDDDVRTNKVLVELDSSEIQKRIVEEEIRFQSSAASLTEAQQAFAIQVNQNLSDIKAAEQKARFARMDFNKFLGDQAADELLTELQLHNLPLTETNLDRYLRPAPIPSPTETNVVMSPTPAELVVATPPGGDGVLPIVGAAGNASANGITSSAPMNALAGATPANGNLLAAEPAAPTTPEMSDTLSEVAATLARQIDVDFSRYADYERLGPGEAKQKLRKFQEDLQLARKELEQARANREGTRRLLEKGFVTRIDMERDDIAYENNRLKVQTAETAQELFLKYEFAKMAEESLSKYLEAVRELDRARKASISKLAQAEARLRSAQAQYNVQFRQRVELQEQLAKCTIRAQKPGLVVYGGGEERWYREEQIREGALVRERQSIITIPDMTRMSAKVKIHESYIKKVLKGQKARITVEAFPDKELQGEVTYVGVLPDSENRWMNPDMKVYRTTVAIDGTHDWLKPGMSAKVEIQVDRLADVVYVPLQAVVPGNGRQYCYVSRTGSPERRQVTVGQFNDSFIQIVTGLREGEVVLLRPPERPGPKPGEQPEETTPQPEAGKPTPTTIQPSRPVNTVTVPVTRA